MTQYLVYDVFTDQPFGGNQLAVVPDARALPEWDLQKIAREFNFSEVTFVYPAKEKENAAYVRIFTPTMEIPFAGHPVIGTALALYDAGYPSEMTLELGIGPVKCTVSGRMASFTTTAALELSVTPEIVRVANALGLSPEAVRTDIHPPIMASLGLAFTITQLVSLQDLQDINTNIDAFKDGRDAYPSSLDFAQFVYVRDGARTHARMFAPLDEIPEDPATGSACATLAALLRHLTGEDQVMKILQGEDMGRPSDILVSADATGVTVSGQARRVMQGKLVYAD